MHKKIAALLEEAMEADQGTVTGDEAMNEIDMDSLATVSFLALVDERMGVSLPPQKLTDAKSIRELAEIIQKEMG